MSKNCNEHRWPNDCLWPEPFWEGYGPSWDSDLYDCVELDEDGQELLEIREYMDELVECGRLLPDYSLNDDYEDEDAIYEDEESCEGDEDASEDEDDVFVPEMGEDYWDDGFDFISWEEDFINHLNLIKIDACEPEKDPVSFVRQVTGYSFVNENLLRQAFTRRAFGLEYGVGDCEVLEFYGDVVLHAVISRELYSRFAEPYTATVESPFRSYRDEGDLSRIRQAYESRDYLAGRAAELGLDAYILYGSGEEANAAAREDMMEALLGAVAVDSNWDWSRLADVVDRLILLQLENADTLQEMSCYDQFNRWHQKHFGSMPEYTVDRNLRIRGEELYDCTLRYLVPKNDRGIWTSQRIDLTELPTRSAAREYAARKAIAFVQSHGLWINLSEAGIEPCLEEAINQLQELYQKKYVEKPSYSFEEHTGVGLEGWYCTCTCSEVKGYGKASGKTKAKKKAAYAVLVRLMGACPP